MIVEINTVMACSAFVATCSYKCSCYVLAKRPHEAKTLTDVRMANAS